ncbi:TOBE domain-containing protein [Globicatella sp. PHS-GS-PNBC-21-1553]|uniref:TOBE domain-containing protein n=1 Tax=Globicatella sp. PHS-GS-PNBC-21-1553 TaxID=2885764 RepID=UPI002B2CE1B4|nr:TOBE domain-containing protein [Globicatella sp. PHS-GS-PNBC-21-1553]
MLPEQFELRDYHVQGKGIVGKLLDQQFLGRETQYGIQLEDGQELVISSNQPQAFHKNQSVLLNFKGGQAS